MRYVLTVLALLLPALAADPGNQQINSMYPDLEKLYVSLHEHPELGFQESETSAKVAQQLRALGYEVATGVGRTGVVAVLRNGSGRTVMLRTDMDALPIEEKTGVPFASKVITKNLAGESVPVMHACGHDVHITAMVGSARMMAQSKQRWHGTLVLVAQPAEEILGGAKAMLQDGLFTRFPKPEYALAIHVEDTMPSGTVGFHAGPFRASSDAVDVTIFGRGGHGAKPQETVDPVLIAARTVLAIHTIVSREIDPQDAVVITVGSIHGGTKRNIIPDEVRLELTVRAYKPEVRKRLLSAIERIAKGESMAGGSPREPIVAIQESADPVINDPEITGRVADRLRRAFGDKLVEMPSQMTSEDFSEYGRAGARSVLLHVGAQDPEKFAKAKASGAQLPSVHTAYFVPDRAQTIKTAVQVETEALLELLADK
jgi:hippurate hydrolase